MTLFHFANCLALAYVPYFLTYKFSGLPEYGAFWKCIQAGTAYIVTQLGKMLILATFFPPSDTHWNSSADVLGELLKASIDVADLVGLHFVMLKIVGKGEIKFLVAGIGWATAELLLTRCVPLWVGARGLEFDWKYIQMSFESNVNLVQHISTAALVWLWSRTDLNKSFVPLVFILLLVTCYKPLLLELICQMMVIESWTLLLIKVSSTVFIAFVALQLYINLIQVSNIH